MKRIIGAFLATLVVVTTAFALPPAWQPLLWPSAAVHDGISLDFATQTYYTKAPGAPARYAAFTDLFTVTRNSLGTFKSQAGEVAYANSNQILQSQTLGTTWTPGETTVTSDAVAAPDQTTTADKIVESINNASHYLGQSITIPTGSTWTASVYLKAAERSRAQFFFGKSGSPFTRGCVDVDLSTGAIGASCTVASPSSVTNSTVTAVGNGWYRVSLTVLADQTSTDGYVEIRLHNGSSTVYTGDGASGIYAWGAQVQRGTALGAYLLTTTVAKYDQPRIDYAATTTGTNLTLQSQTLDHASWVKTSASVTADATTAPDGTATADLFLEDGTTNFHVNTLTPGGALANAAIGEAYRFSFYAKAAGRTRISVQIDAVAGPGRGDFDLSGVSAAVTGVGSSATITDVGNGWYRCSVTMTPAATGALIFKLLLGSSSFANSYAGDGVSGVYVWGAQIEQGTVASQYTATTTAPVYKTASTGVVGYLSEATRTNISIRSEEMDSVSWTASNITTSAQFGTAPDGTVTSDKIVETAVNAVHGNVIGVTVSAGGTYALSAFVKPAGRRFAYLYAINVDQYGAIFDLTNLTSANITSGLGTVTAKGIESWGNGWYRIWVSGVMNGSATTLNFVGGPGISLTVPAGYTYLGDVNAGIEMWGVQIEAGNFPSSYIPTSSSSIARAADSAIRTLGSEFNAAAGAVVVAGRASGGQAVGIGQCVWSLWTDVNNRYTYVRPSASDVARFTINNGGVNQATLDATFTNSASFKVASAWVANDFATTINGTAVLTDGAGTLPAVAVLGLGELGDASSTMNGHILRFHYYPVRKPSGFLVQQSTPGP